MLSYLRVCLLGQATSRHNGASCGQASPNGNTVSIKRLDAYDLLLRQAYTGLAEKSSSQPVRILAQELRLDQRLL
jgi:hypothetical protein